MTRTVQLRRFGREHPPSGYPNRIALSVKQFHRVVEDHRRSGLRQLTGPRPVRVGQGHQLVAERGQGDAFGGTATAGQHRQLHSLLPQ